MTEAQAFGTVGGALVVAVVFAVVCVSGDLKAPTEALKEWTDWAGKVVGILVAARVLWAGANFIESKA